MGNVSGTWKLQSDIQTKAYKLIMMNQSTLIIILIIVMLCCCCCSYKETFIDFDDDWDWNNPSDAAQEFVENHSNFILEEPDMPFNEGMITERTTTYWPNAFIKRVK